MKNFPDDRFSSGIPYFFANSFGLLRYGVGSSNDQNCDSAASLLPKVPILYKLAPFATSEAAFRDSLDKDCLAKPYGVDIPENLVNPPPTIFKTPDVTCPASPLFIPL